MPARTRLTQIVAQVLILALVLGLLPSPAQAALPSSSSAPAALPDLPLTDSVPALLLVAVAIADGAPCAVVAAVLTPSDPIKYNRARWYDGRVGRFVGMDPLSNIGLHSYSYVGNDPVNKVDPSGLFGEEAFAALSVMTTLASISSIVTRSVTAKAPLAVATDLLIVNGNDRWDETSAMETFTEAQALWADKAGIFFRPNSIKRIPSYPILEKIPTDSDFDKALPIIDLFARGNHVSVFIGQPAITGLLGIVDGIASKGRYSGKRGYAFVNGDGRTLAHEWGHTLSLLHNDAFRNLMSSGGAGGTNLYDDQISKARDYAKTY